MAFSSKLGIFCQILNDLDRFLNKILIIYMIYQYRFGKLIILALKNAIHLKLWKFNFGDTLWVSLTIFVYTIF